MTQAVEFLVLGIASGALIAMLSLGVVVVHRGSGVVNFGQGAMAMVGAYVFYDLNQNHGVNYAVSLVAGTLTSGVVGLLTYVLVMRPLRRAPMMNQVIATLGVLAVLEQGASHIVSPAPLYVPPELPTATWKVLGARIGEDKVIFVAIAVLITVVLSEVYRRTQLGRATAAALENSRATRAQGISPDRVASINWLIGGCLAGLAGVLLAPIDSLSVSTYTLLVLPALAAAVFGSLNSLWLALVGSMVIGVVQSEVTRYVTTPGWNDAAPFLLIIAVLAVRGVGKRSRSMTAVRLPKVGTGQIRLRVVLPVLAAAFLVTQAGLSDYWLGALVITCGTAIILLSFVIVTGYSGQLSLAQFAFAGLGAWIAGKLLTSAHEPLLLAVLGGVILVVPVGAVLGAICVRTTGVSLTIATLGFAVAVENLVFDSPKWTGAFGIVVGSPRLFGWGIDAVDYPSRYAAVAVIALTIAAVVTANVRRGVVGRRLLAIRANERAAASLGMRVTHVKVFAFAVGSGVAAFGGIVIGFASRSVIFSNFSTLPAIQAVTEALVGGVGWVAGAAIGGIAQVGGLLSQALNHWIGTTAASYVPLAGGVLLIIVLVGQPDGGAAIIARQIGPVLRVLGLRPETGVRAALETARQRHGARSERVAPATLKVDDLRVTFGSVVAVDGVCLEVRPGEVVGLIGPNGAGKTTVIDAVAGYVRYGAGRVSLNNRSIDAAPAATRAREGLTRSFQSLELFEDISVFGNLVAASDPCGVSLFATDIFYPRRPQLSQAAVDAIPEFGLEDVLTMMPDELSYGTRRLVAIARAVASSPSVLLLDEPAAGLDDHERSELTDLVRRLADQWGMGVLLVEHDVAMVMRACDRIYAMELGRVIASGTPEEVRNNPEVRRAYLGRDGGDVEPTWRNDKEADRVGSDGV